MMMNSQQWIGKEAVTLGTTPKHVGASSAGRPTRMARSRSVYYERRTGESCGHAADSTFRGDSVFNLK